MKRLIFLIIFLIAGLLCGPNVIQAADPYAVISSGVTTTDRLIATGNCTYYGMTIISGASTATVAIYDSTAASGTTIDYGACPTASAWCPSPNGLGVEVFTGIYADVTGTGASYTVYYRCE